MSVRNPWVAGAFYPEAEPDLRRTLAELLPPAARPVPALAVLLPHAGYAYSGGVAGAVLSRVEVPARVVLLGFNHRNLGRPFALWTEGAWKTPLGTVAVDAELVDRIAAAFPRAEPDESAFLREHCLEVQLPFLQARRPDVRIAPVSLNTLDRSALADFGRALASATAPLGDPVLAVATTDLTHCGEGYGVAPRRGMTPRDWAREQDGHVLERIAALEAPGFWDVVLERGVSMCGVAPTAAMIEYARARGAEAATIVRYATSADDEPDADRAVGYPGVLVPVP